MERLDDLWNYEGQNCNCRVSNLFGGCFTLEFGVFGHFRIFSWGNDSVYFVADPSNTQCHQYHRLFAAVGDVAWAHVHLTNASGPILAGGCELHRFRLSCVIRATSIYRYGRDFILYSRRRNCAPFLWSGSLLPASEEECLLL